MTDAPLVSFLVVTHVRTDDAIEAIDSALAQSYEHKEVVVVASELNGTYETLNDQYSANSAVIVVPETEPSGPPAARNTAFEYASGELLVIIDDDAVFESTAAANNIVEAFADHPNVGVLSFRSQSYVDGSDNLIEIPYGPEGKYPARQSYTTYFVGVGAAFRREAIEAVEGFPEEYYYAMEELDISLQIMDAGFEMLYFPDVVVKHKKSAGGRPQKDEQWRLMLTNRVRVSVRHLPWRYVISSTLVWSAYVLYKTGGSLTSVLGAYRNIVPDLPALYEQRDVIAPATRRRISELNGRLWY